MPRARLARWPARAQKLIMDGYLDIYPVSGAAPAWSRAHRKIPTQSEIAAILATSDPVLRNLRITQTYHELTLALADHLGRDDLNWCAYATWASKSAGRFIRGEPLDVLPRRALSAGGRLAPWLADLAAGVRAGATEGNLMVFAELAPFYAALVELLRATPRPDHARIDALLGRFARGPVERGGQDMLRRAFAAYLEIAALPRCKARAERMLLANALVGYHEQTRLQGPIERALGAPLLAARLGRVVRAASTRWLMALELPGETVRLGEDVHAPGGDPMFPDELRAIDDRELCALLYRLDRTPNTTAGSAAGDWADLGDRMNFIVDLFRSRQRDARLYRAPFSPAQLAAIRAGRVPPGPL
ncbi:MAG: hypothetical protein IT372_19055 [Polyangiaceae bacterium]|nr:hypothetical protein [Polyangiaceae bacterium]